MKLTEQTELEIKLLEQQLRFYHMINGILAVSVFAGAALLLYKIVKVIIN